jgi:leader peptidase (prepilin peptidase)/N-methyltransferase
MNEFLEMLHTSPWLFIGLCVALGLMIGSFLNVVIHRVPIMMDNELRTECALQAAQDAAQRGEAVAEVAEPPVYNIVTPRSACPKCRAPITAVQNIPVVSWLLLGGKCASCQNPISRRYPLVELATGILSASSPGGSALDSRASPRWRSPGS